MHWNKFDSSNWVACRLGKERWLRKEAAFESETGGDWWVVLMLFPILYLSNSFQFFTAVDWLCCVQLGKKEVASEMQKWPEKEEYNKKRGRALWTHQNGAILYENGVLQVERSCSVLVVFTNWSMRHLKQKRKETKCRQNIDEPKMEMNDYKSYLCRYA